MQKLTPFGVDKGVVTSNFSADLSNLENIIANQPRTTFVCLADDIL